MGCSDSKRQETASRKGVDAAGGFHDTHRLLQKLGQGSCSSVYLARAKSCKSVDLAVKAFDFSTSGAPCDDESKQRLRREVEIMKMVRNEMHCVEFFDFYEEGNLSYIVMERCESSLPRALEETSDLSVPVIANCIQQMLQGLSLLHIGGIVHRDVKLANFLVSGSIGRHHVVKLCDFGSATVVPGGPGSTAALWDVCGTVPFSAPEMLNFWGYGTRADMWSLGVVVHLLLLGQYVYMPRPLTIQKIKTSIQEDCPKATFIPAPGLSNTHVTPSMLSFLQALLNRDVAKRVSANRAMKMDWLRSSLRHGSSSNKGSCHSSLKPMLMSAKKLGAFNSEDQAGAMTSIDRQLHALQALHGQTSPRKARPFSPDSVTT